MYLCRNCQQPINPASEICPYCGADQAASETDTTAKPVKKRSSLRLILLMAAAVAGIWAIIWLALPLRFQNPRPTAEHAALESLRSVAQELANYAFGAGTYPQRLETLGAQARQAAQEAMTGGYTLQYTPGQPDAKGNVRSYSLAALPRNYGYRSFFTDQTGVIRATRDNRPANAQDPPIGK